MTDTKKPATEAGAEERELANYELAFHVLPTVAEGEVSNVFQSLKDIITNHGGSLTVEEAPARFDLAYEIVKYLEGRNRKFTSAYFGWVRFTIDPSKIEEVVAEVEAKNELLRHLLTKLTSLEEAYPFYFHEALEQEKKVETIEVEEEKESEDEESEEDEVDEEEGEKIDEVESEEGVETKEDKA